MGDCIFPNCNKGLLSDPRFRSKTKIEMVLFGFYHLEADERMGRSYFAEIATRHMQSLHDLCTDPLFRSKTKIGDFILLK